ncbi:MAG: glutaredoxin family protein [Betaproteobacteria bacterium]
MGVELTLLGRTYCHLCDDMWAALAPLAQEFGASVEWVDVDSDSELEQRFGDLVPVLLFEGAELCHYFLDEAKVRECLAEIR